MTAKRAFLALSITITVAAASADTVIMKDGKTLRGKVLRQSDSTVVLEDQAGATLSLRMSDIRMVSVDDKNKSKSDNADERACDEGHDDIEFEGDASFSMELQLMVGSKQHKPIVVYADEAMSNVVGSLCEDAIRTDIDLQPYCGRGKKQWPPSEAIPVVFRSVTDGRIRTGSDQSHHREGYVRGSDVVPTMAGSFRLSLGAIRTRRLDSLCLFDDDDVVAIAKDLPPESRDIAVSHDGSERRLSTAREVLIFTRYISVPTGALEQLKNIPDDQFTRVQAEMNRIQDSARNRALRSLRIVYSYDGSCFIERRLVQRTKTDKVEKTHGVSVAQPCPACGGRMPGRAACPRCGGTGVAGFKPGGTRTEEKKVERSVLTGVEPRQLDPSDPRLGKLKEALLRGQE